MMEQTLKFQQQPNNTTCVCTCIAMILDIPAQEVIDLYHEKYYEQNYSIRNILDGYGIKFTSFDTANRGGMDEAESGYYMVTVPSLNFVGGMHQVVVEIDADEGLFYVLDPQFGTEAKYYTTGPNDDPRAVMIGNGYTLDAMITKQDLADWKQNR